jgi:ABC-2 type transport system permease protein
MFSLSIASLIKNRDRVMGFGQLMTMPLFFASSAIYPIALMPSWLQAVALVNPLTYMVSATRALMVSPDIDLQALALDFGVLSVFALVLLFIAARCYPRVAV